MIVALGGGSAMDTAKVVAASDGDFARVRTYVESGKGAEKLGRTPIIAVPTTAGTGSEVTCWATVWDTANKKKYSLARPELYPEVAILDPEVTLGIPRALTVSTGLDALSHALESLWNTNANPVSANHAVFAAQEVLECLPALRKGSARSRTALAPDAGEPVCRASPFPTPRRPWPIPCPIISRCIMACRTALPVPSRCRW